MSSGACWRGSEGTTKETVRLEAFSDAVFAIAITLLALEVRIADPDVRLARALTEMWRVYVAYLLSFLTILIMWLNHHALLLWVRRVEGKLLVANGILLMLVALVPFPTTLVGEYLGEADGKYAVAAYTGLFLLITLAFLWVWWLVSSQRREIAPALRKREVSLTNRFLAFGLAGYLVAVALAFVFPVASLGLSMAMVVFWLGHAYRHHRVAEAQER
jgi:uncharacterized membrane protein